MEQKRGTWAGGCGADLKNGVSDQRQLVILQNEDNNCCRHHEQSDKESFDRCLLLEELVSQLGPRVREEATTTAAGSAESGIEERVCVIVGQPDGRKDRDRQQLIVMDDRDENAIEGIGTGRQLKCRSHSRRRRPGRR